MTLTKMNLLVICFNHQSPYICFIQSQKFMIIHYLLHYLKFLQGCLTLHLIIESLQSISNLSYHPHHLSQSQQFLILSDLARLNYSLICLQSLLAIVLLIFVYFNNAFINCYLNSTNFSSNIHLNYIDQIVKWSLVF